MLTLNNNTTVVITGAGAVENSWKPVLNALKPFVNLDLTPDMANSYLARLVYSVRWAFNENIALEIKKKYLAHLNEVKKSICFEIEKSQRTNEITTNSFFLEIVSSLRLVPSKKFSFINTNWDTTIDKTLSNLLSKDLDFPSFHIHGKYLEHSSMYLPSETINELYRDIEANNLIANNHLQMINYIKQAESIILYGISLSALDIELCHILSIGLENGNLREAIIIDKDPPTVEGRFKMLLSNPYDIEIKKVAININ